MKFQKGESHSDRNQISSCQRLEVKGEDVDYKGAGGKVWSNESRLNTVYYECHYIAV